MLVSRRRTHGAGKSCARSRAGDSPVFALRHASVYASLYSMLIVQPVVEWTLQHEGSEHLDTAVQSDPVHAVQSQPAAQPYNDCGLAFRGLGRE